MPVRHGLVRTGLLALAALVVIGGSLAAQETRVGVSAGRTTDANGDARTAVTVAPSLSWSTPRSAVGLSGQATRFEGGEVLGWVSAWGTGMVVQQGPWAATMSGEGSLGGSSKDTRAAGILLRPRARVGGVSWRIEAGPTLAIAAGAGGSHAALPPLSPHRAPLLGAGEPVDTGFALRTQRGWGVGGMVDRSDFGLAATWQGAELDGLRWGEWTMEAALAADRVILSGQAGGRTGDLRDRWLSGRLIGRVSPRTSLVAEAGTSPSNPLMGWKGGRTAALGLVLTSMPHP